MNFSDYTKKAGEMPLERLVAGGGFCGILRTVACIGDSLASGEFEGTGQNGETTHHDLYDYSWGQFMAREAGIDVYNFSRGGMTAKEYIESFAEDNGFWEHDKAAKAYIIALGANDLFCTDIELGSVSDICLNDPDKNKETFAGYYAAIIQRYKEIQPDAKFFLVTMPREQSEKRNEKEAIHKELMYQLADFFSNTYVIDLFTYAPVYDAEYEENFHLGRHLNACGYMLTAKMIMSYIDYIIRNNMTAFSQVGFIGTPFKNTSV